MHLPDMKQVLTLAAALVAASSVMGQERASRLLNRGAPRAGNAAAAASATARGDAVAEAAGVDDQDDTQRDLNFREAPVDMVFAVYGKLVDKTVLKDPQTPNVNITLESRPGQKLTKEEQIEAIEVVLEMNGIHIEPYGETDKFVRSIARKDAGKEGIPLFMDPNDEIIRQLPMGKVISVMLNFKNISVQDEAQKALEGFKSATGLLQVFERTNSILVTDTRQNILRMIEIARAIDISTPVLENVYVRQIKNASASDIKTALEQIVTESQKELENTGKAQQNAAASAASRGVTPSAGSSLLRRPPSAKDAPAAPASIESLVTSVSDADRGLIRGKVLILADERSNKLIVITSKSNMDFFDKVIEQLDVETTPDTLVKVYRLKYAEAEDVADMINDLIGNSANSRSNSRQNANQNSRAGTGGNLTRGNQAGGANNRTGANNTTQRASANQRTGEPKAGELSKDNTTVLADKRINGIVVMTQKELVPTIENIIESMDVRLSQVLIETVIIEVTLGDDLQTGVDWVKLNKTTQTTYSQAKDHLGNNLYYLKNASTGALSSYMGTEASSDAWPDGYEISNVPVISTAKETVRGLWSNVTGNRGYQVGGGGGNASGLLQSVVGVATNSAALTPIGSGLNYFLKSDKLNLAAIVQASKSDSRAKYIASPIVMTVDNKEATIEATEARKFFSGYETSSSYSTYTRTPKYDSKDIGITIKVTPKINPNGTVMLEVEEEYSQLGAGQSILVDDGSNAFIDTALTRKMSADILLENGQSVILGGLTQTRTSESETGIPLLKDIPYIGKWLFGSVSQTESRNELLVFMTPYVLDDAESAQAEALRRKRAVSDPKPWDDHGWSASALADPVSKKEMMRRLKDEAKKQDEERQTKLAIEKWKLDRAKALEKMDAGERKFWLDAHRDELEKEEKERFDEQMKDQSDLKLLAAQIRERRLGLAEDKMEEAATAAAAENEHGRIEAEKAKKAHAVEISVEEPAEAPAEVPAEVPVERQAAPVKGDQVDSLLSGLENAQ